MANKLTGQGLADFTKGKEGTPYVYGAKGADGVFTQARCDSLAAAYPDTFTTSYLNKIKSKGLIGKVCTDCSGLISWYTGKVYGSAQLYDNAYARLPIANVNDFAIGTVLWKSGHVGCYLGNGKCAEAKGIDYGTIISNVSATSWKYGLTFSWMDYDIETPIDSSEITYKTANPYKEPTKNVKRGDSGESVKYVQFELVQAGYDIKIDGEFGSATLSAVKSFQKSCKLTVDGIVGECTLAALKADNSGATFVNPYPEPTKNLKKGDKGDDVAYVQTQLNYKGNYGLAVDKSFGSKTDSAVRSFQKSNKLTVDGIVGECTLAALKA